MVRGVRYGVLSALAIVGIAIAPMAHAGAATVTIDRVSVASDTTQANGRSPSGETPWGNPSPYDDPAASDDGRYVAFTSAADNLVGDDTNGVTDVFLRDRVAGTTRLVSHSATNGAANGESGDPSISADGRYVAFTSAASNIVFVDADHTTDVFVFDRVTGQIRLVSYGTDGYPVGAINGRITADGSAVALLGSLLVYPRPPRPTVFVRDLATGAVHAGADVPCAAMTSDCGLVGFEMDDDASSFAMMLGYVDARQAVLGSPTIALYTAHGTGSTGVARAAGPILLNGNTTISYAIAGDGHRVVWQKCDGTCSDVMEEHDGGASTPVSHTKVPAIDLVADLDRTGRFLLLRGDPDGSSRGLYLFDTQSTTVRLASPTRSGAAPNTAVDGVLTGTGGSAVFASDSPAHVPNDTDNVSDVFVIDRLGMPVAPK